MSMDALIAELRDDPLGLDYRSDGHDYGAIATKLTAIPVIPNPNPAPLVEVEQVDVPSIGQIMDVLGYQTWMPLMVQSVYGSLELGHSGGHASMENHIPVVGDWAVGGGKSDISSLDALAQMDAEQQDTAMEAFLHVLWRGGQITQQQAQDLNQLITREMVEVPDPNWEPTVRERDSRYEVLGLGPRPLRRKHVRDAIRQIEDWPNATD